VTARLVLRRASVRVHFRDFDNVFLDPVTLHVLQMTAIEVISMLPMPNSGVATGWAMDVPT
jgi:hypothetical protein